MATPAYNHIRLRLCLQDIRVAQDLEYGVGNAFRMIEVAMQTVPDFNVEIDLPALREHAASTSKPRPFIEEFVLQNGRRLNLLADGRLINLVAAEGHPATVMDMSFANQALSVEYAVKQAGTLENRVYVVPPEIDVEVARLKLSALGIAIDVLSEEQQRYLESWTEGT